MTLAAVGCFVTLYALELLGVSFALTKGARWAGIPDIRFRHALAANLLVAALSILLWVSGGFVPTDLMPNPIVLLVIEVVVSLLITWCAIAMMFKTSVTRAILAWLPTLIPAAGALALILLVIRPFMFEGFLIPAGSMAPTLTGPHTETSCPQCGSTAIVPWLEERFRGAPEDHQAVCIAQHHVFTVSKDGPQKLPGDRILVNKLLRPQRWDMIAFRAPASPSDIWIKRIVGLPNEQVVIRNGAVWINGKEMPVPAECGVLKYAPGTGFPGTGWGTPEHPGLLGPDEYFVLGDFAEMSFDSRMWQQGAPGHHPYAVPGSYIQGVVTHIYWPVSRWRTFR